MSLEILLQAAEYLDKREKDAEHGYASVMFDDDLDHDSSSNAGQDENKHSKKLNGKRSSHNELEKCRRAYLRNCLNGLKDLVPLDANTYRHTTLGLLNKAKYHIKHLEETARILAARKEKLYQEQKLLRQSLANLVLEHSPGSLDGINSISFTVPSDPNNTNTQLHLNYNNNFNNVIVNRTGKINHNINNSLQSCNSSNVRPSNLITQENLAALGIISLDDKTHLNRVEQQTPNVNITNLDVGTKVNGFSLNNNNVSLNGCGGGNQNFSNSGISTGTGNIKIIKHPSSVLSVHQNSVGTNRNNINVNANPTINGLYGVQSSQSLLASNFNNSNNHNNATSFLFPGGISTATNMLLNKKIIINNNNNGNGMGINNNGSCSPMISLLANRTPTLLLKNNHNTNVGKIETTVLEKSNRLVSSPVSNDYENATIGKTVVSKGKQKINDDTNKTYQAPLGKKLRSSDSESSNVSSSDQLSINSATSSLNTSAYESDEKLSPSFFEGSKVFNLQIIDSCTEQTEKNDNVAIDTTKEGNVHEIVAQTVDQDASKKGELHDGLTTTPRFKREEVLSSTSSSGFSSENNLDEELDECGNTSDESLRSPTKKTCQIMMSKTKLPTSTTEN